MSSYYKGARLLAPHAVLQPNVHGGGLVGLCVPYIVYLACCCRLSDTVAATALGVSLVSALAAVVRPIVVHVRARQHLAQAIQAAPDGLSSDQSRLQPSQVVLVPPKAAKVVRSEEMHMQQQGEAGQGQQEGAHKAGDGGG